MDILQRILDSRGFDHKEITDPQRYIDFVVTGIVYESAPGICHAFVLPGGECIGYTRTHSGNPHYLLASILFPDESNPLLRLDLLGAIKIKNTNSLRCSCPGIPPITQEMRETWEKILEKSGWGVFCLGWSGDDFEGSWYSLSEIRQMDNIILNKHLTE